MFIAALLTIIGYSINDTVVVFDRIRENLGIKAGSEIIPVVNESINKTISRTLITSLTTFVVVLVLLLLVLLVVVVGDDEVCWRADNFGTICTVEPSTILLS